VYPRLVERIPEYLQDRDSYVEIARNLIDGRGYALEPGAGPTLRRMPAYPLFLAGVLAVAGGWPPAVFLSQLGLVAGSALFVYGLGRRESPGAGLAAAAFLGLYPLVLVYTPRYFSEILLTLFMSGGLWCLLRFRETDRTGFLLGAAALFAGAWLTRASVGLVLAGLAVLLAGEPRLAGKRRRLAAAAGMFAALAGTWVAWSWSVAGTPVFGSIWDTRSAVHGLRVMKDPAAERAPRELDHRFIRITGEELDRRVGPADSPTREVRQARESVAIYLEELYADPAGALLAYVRGFFRIFFLTSTPAARVVGGVANFGLALLMAAGAALAARHAAHPVGRYLGMVVGVQFVFQSLVFPMTRYLFPLLPAAAVLAGIGARRTYLRLRTRNRLPRKPATGCA
jgi:hypothetical protein